MARDENFRRSFLTIPICFFPIPQQCLSLPKITRVCLSCANVDLYIVYWHKSICSRHILLFCLTALYAAAAQTFHESLTGCLNTANLLLECMWNGWGITSSPCPYSSSYSLRFICKWSGACAYATKCCKNSARCAGFTIQFSGKKRQKNWIFGHGPVAIKL